jgi:hypothetical protein
MTVAKPIEEVTELQAEAYVALIRHVARWGFQPSLRELGKMLGCTGRAALERLRHLERKGLVKLNDTRRMERAVSLVHVKFEPEVVGKGATVYGYATRAGKRFGTMTQDR